MPKTITIKQIAKMAGVSPGTVDRVLHNRGKVSPENLEKISRILEDHSYHANIHKSALSLRKSFRILLFIPRYTAGSYWDGQIRGFEMGIREYSDIDIVADKLTYDQYDVHSFIETSSQALSMKPDGIILGPTFRRETIDFCHKLEKEKIPYVFVDTIIPETSPVARYAPDQRRSGLLLSNILDLICEKDKSLLIVNPKRLGSESFNTIEREEAIREAYSAHGIADRLKMLDLSMQDSDFAIILRDYLNDNPDVGIIAVPNSRANEIAACLDSDHVGRLKIGGYDLTDGNRECLMNESISFILDQKPEQQAFQALKALLSYLIFGRVHESLENEIKIEVIFRENCINPLKNT